MDQLDRLRLKERKFLELSAHFHDARRPKFREPRFITPPHEVTDPDKVAAMVDVLRNGEDLPAIYVRENGKAVSGTHRLAAYREIGRAIPTITVTDKQFKRALDSLDVYDWEEGDGLQLHYVEAQIFLQARKKRN